MGKEVFVTAFLVRRTFAASFSSPRLIAYIIPCSLDDIIPSFLGQVDTGRNMYFISSILTIFAYFVLSMGGFFQDLAYHIYLRRWEEGALDLQVVCLELRLSQGSDLIQEI